jgi:hypothetical protein
MELFIGQKAILASSEFEALFPVGSVVIVCEQKQSDVNPDVPLYGVRVVCYDKEKFFDSPMLWVKGEVLIVQGTFTKSSNASFPTQKSFVTVEDLRQQAESMGFPV